MLFSRNRTVQLSPAEAAAGERKGELVLVDVREGDERGLIAWTEAGLLTESGAER